MDIIRRSAHHESASAIEGGAMAIRTRPRRCAASVGLTLFAWVLLGGEWSSLAAGITPITTVVSVATDGSAGDQPSFGASINATGRFVAFSSGATTLVPGDTNGRGDVFVRDRQAGQTTLVSVASDGAQANEGSGIPGISGNGRFVAFSSGATNLVPGDTNPHVDVFVHDRETGETTRVSVASDGAQASGSGFVGSTNASMSADGRFVAFESSAPNLVPGDTNTCLTLPNIAPGECSDVFVHDRDTGQTTRVSVASDGTQADDQSFLPALSADGRFVAFSSLATNLVPGDTNSLLDIFVHDRRTGETTRVSVASDGTQASGNPQSSSGSSYASISANGHFVAFVSDVSNLVPGDTNGRRSLVSGQDVFVHDRETGETTRASLGFNGRQANDASVDTSISGDGRFVAFSSYATNLVRADTTRIEDVFVRDRSAGTTVRASVASDGTQASGSAGLFTFSAFPSISASGRFVAFESIASNLVSSDANDSEDVFVHELAL
jgi:archaellum component FlaF (FlaF/FlaG flagellin family)